MFVESGEKGQWARVVARGKVEFTFCAIWLREHCEVYCKSISCGIDGSYVLSKISKLNGMENDGSGYGNHGDAMFASTTFTCQRSC